MREAYALFKDGGDPEKLVASFSSGTDGEVFYSSLYAGLYYESQKNAEKAKSHTVAACKSPYGSRFCFPPPVLVHLFRVGMHANDPIACVHQIW